jgi:SAM dependent carboxyl methyltransferase
MSTGGDAGGVTTGMKSGGYYDAHSEYQRRVVEGGDASIRSIVADLDLGSVDGALGIVDYGAGTGATSVHSMRTAIAAVRERDGELPVLAAHNDVITSDFTTLFANVAGPEGYLELGGGPVFSVAAAGSFYSQVVPAATVHLGRCSNASHWFRDQPRVELADGMFFSDADGPVRRQLADEAAADWSRFLAARAGELAPGGRLLVEGIGRTEGPDGGERVSASRLLRVMWEAAVGLGDDGKLDRGVLDGYVFPVYCRSADEATAPARDGGELAGALDVASAHVDEVPNPYWEQLKRDGDRDAYAAAYTAFVRAFSEATLKTHLFEPGARGTEPDALCDEFFARFQAATAADPEAGRYEAWILRVVFARR